MVVGQDFKTDTKKKANSICERSFSLPSKAVRLIGLDSFLWFFPSCYARYIQEQWMSFIASYFLYVSQAGNV